MPARTSFSCWVCGGRVVFLGREDIDGNYYRCEREGVRAAQFGALVAPAQPEVRA